MSRPATLSRPGRRRALRGLVSGIALYLVSIPVAPLLHAGDAVAFRSWLALRDDGVVKQQRDFSCGVAALATYLGLYLNTSVSEAELLQLLQLRGDDWGLPEDWREQGVSYATLIALATYHGVQAAGLAVTPERLMSLRVPAIVRLQVDGVAHFSVLRGIDRAGRLHLADPSWGNRQLSSDRFLTMWLDPTQNAQVGTLMLLRNDRSLQPRDGPGALQSRRPLVRAPG